MVAKPQTKVYSLKTDIPVYSKSFDKGLSTRKPIEWQRLLSQLEVQIRAHVCIDIDLSILLMCLIQINNLHVLLFEFRLLEIYSPYLICKYTHTCINSNNSRIPHVFYLEQLSAVVFGKQVHILMTEGFLVKVCTYMCLCICVCSNFSLKLQDQ